MHIYAPISCVYLFIHAQAHDRTIPQTKVKIIFSLCSICYVLYICRLITHANIKVRQKQLKNRCTRYLYVFSKQFHCNSIARSTFCWPNDVTMRAPCSIYNVLVFLRFRKWQGCSGHIYSSESGSLVSRNAGTLKIMLIRNLICSKICSIKKI